MNSVCKIGRRPEEWEGERGRLIGGNGRLFQTNNEIVAAVAGRVGRGKRE